MIDFVECGMAMQDFLMILLEICLVLELILLLVRITCFSGKKNSRRRIKCKYDRLQSALFRFQYFGKQRLVPAVHPVEFANCHCGRPLQQKICRSGNDLHFFLLFLSQKHFHGL